MRHKVGDKLSYPLVRLAPLFHLPLSSNRGRIDRLLHRFSLRQNRRASKSIMAFQSELYTMTTFMQGPIAVTMRIFGLLGGDSVYRYKMTQEHVSLLWSADYQGKRKGCIYWYRVSDLSMRDISMRLWMGGIYWFDDQTFLILERWFLLGWMFLVSCCQVYRPRIV